MAPAPLNTLNTQSTIRIARSAGACYGVERALAIVNTTAEKNDRVQTLGPLIHNPQVVSELEARGVSVAQSVSDAQAPVVVVRTHGVVPQVIEEAKTKGHEVVDATCPYVKKVHHAAASLQQQGYQVLVVGEAGHPEVEGILGHAPQATVVSGPQDLEGHKLKKRVGVVVQTTQSQATLSSIVEVLLGLVEEVRVINTRCSATQERQSAAQELAQDSDVMVVIGGRNSANTTRLAQICAAACPRTHHIEDASELAASWFDGAQNIGITAGASTPQIQIDAVVARIQELVERHE